MKKKYKNVINLTDLTLFSFFGVDYTNFPQSVDHQLMSILLPFEYFFYNQTGKGFMRSVQ